jgi:hypothetical protein
MKTSQRTLFTIILLAVGTASPLARAGDDTTPAKVGDKAESPAMP